MFRRCGVVGRWRRVLPQEADACATLGAYAGMAMAAPPGAEGRCRSEARDEKTLRMYISNNTKCLITASCCSSPALAAAAAAPAPRNRRALLSPSPGHASVEALAFVRRWNRHGLTILCHGPSCNLNTLIDQDAGNLAVGERFCGVFGSNELPNHGADRSC